MKTFQKLSDSKCSVYYPGIFGSSRRQPIASLWPNINIDGTLFKPTLIGIDVSWIISLISESMRALFTNRGNYENSVE